MGVFRKRKQKDRPGTLLRRHLARALREIGANSHAQDLLARVVADDLFSAAASAIEDGLADALAGRLVTFSKTEPGLLLAISVCPWPDPDEFRAHLPGGYLRLLDDVARPVMTQGTPGLDFIHLTYCSGEATGARSGIHKTVITSGTAGLVLLPR